MKIKDHKSGILVKAAREEFALKGYARTTVESITRRAGVAKGTYYLYFKKKEDIIYRIIEETADNISSLLEEQYARFLNKERPFEELIYDIIYRSISEFMNMKDIILTNTYIDFEFSPKLSRFKEKNQKKILDYMNRILDLALKRKLIRPIDVESNSIILLAAFMQAAKELVFRGEAGRLEYYVSVLRDLLLYGIGMNTQKKQGSDNV
ncbi:MAG TPA: TetR/AcrR family transcriptional regulator [Spirochaetota bacterium]|nr:TetR/AcrR family transcriptional regulator [Spirochaetota bacterium]HPI90757.1 TetR/AcrR family transcriptional regulator [Spirochaetota bacterium]HPR49368.1 TetR/AcrR family transcriptional regulator [Spirochaetota bacterium]